jgi:predicted enzyme related to lactoylglutathione lyase
MDTTDGEELGRFWADVLGLGFEPDGGPGNIVGPTEGHGVAMCQVPEAKTVKHRVHIDVKAASVADLEARAASVVRPEEESGLRWTVMSDPEGGEFCAFLRTAAELPDYRFYALVVDAVDAQQIARWWGGVFGVQPQEDEKDAFWYLEHVPGMPFEAVVFVPVPEPKTVKNRMHLDIDAADIEAEAARLEALGARRVADDQVHEHGTHWILMADPEGNEFCVCDGGAGSS